MMLLKDCGVESMTMGIQSGSEYILKEIYNRHTSTQKILTSTRLLGDLDINYNITINV